MPQPLTWDSLNLAYDTPGLTWDAVAPTPQPNPTMSIDNRISKTVSPAQKSAIEAAIAALHTALTTPENLLTNLTTEERRTLPKIGDKTMAFDDKCKTYMAQHPELIPNFVDMAEMAKDRALVAALLPCLRDLAPLCEGLDDTITVASSDNYMADLAFYQSTKVAAKRGVVGSDTIYTDLKERFPGRAQPTPPPTP
jgi:hypothetical protein